MSQYSEMQTSLQALQALQEFESVERVIRDVGPLMAALRGLLSMTSVAVRIGCEAADVLEQLCGTTPSALR